MDFEAIVGSTVGKIPGGVYAVLAAFIVGLVGIITLCIAIGSGSGSKSSQNELRKKSTSEEDDEVVETKGKQQPRNKGLKFKQQTSKKVTLPPHPLLAAEFKGHTGTVLSLDFDCNGKYLASCSDGKSVHSHMIHLLGLDYIV